ncbi:hypothetical protein AALP_AA3G134600 [Arabis alpina]|uniref:3'-5' exonuclease domain-containing protein n=1 Tax=Arabis alpina TaxID=50452 RepID=A0A087H8Z7_ARAAL|nr:hypothetical protein AALP_AA3G134600 [Arabis alpina]
MAPRIRTTASYSTHQEYTVDFFGENLIVTVTSNSSVINRWIRDVHFYNHPLVVGVGVQWTPAFYYYDDSPPESNYYSDSPTESDYHFSPPVDTLQLCVGNRCIIIQLSHCDSVPDILHGFVEDQETTFVGVWNSQDARKLEESKHQLWISDLLDLRKFVVDSQGRSLRGCSFEEIVEVCLGRRGVSLDPEISMSDWRFNLSHDQILQASIDAFVCCKLGVRNRLWEV